MLRRDWAWAVRVGALCGHDKRECKPPLARHVSPRQLRAPWLAVELRVEN